MKRGHCGHWPQCQSIDPPDDRDLFGCCNCGTREAEKKNRSGDGARPTKEGTLSPKEEIEADINRRNHEIRMAISKMDALPDTATTADAIGDLRRLLEESRAKGLAMPTALGGLRIALREYRQRPDFPDILRQVGEMTGIPALEAAGVVWWAPAAGETYHPTAEEFLEHVRASSPANRPEGAKESSDGA